MLQHEDVCSDPHNHVKKATVVMHACNKCRGQRQEDWSGFLITNIASDLDKDPISEE